MPKQEETRVRLSLKEYHKLKKIAEIRGVSLEVLLAEGISKLEVKKVQKEKENDDEEDVYLCGACEEEIPEDADFCPYCGVELGEEEEEEEAKNEE